MDDYRMASHKNLKERWKRFLSYNVVPLRWLPMSRSKCTHWHDVHSWLNSECPLRALYTRPLRNGIWSSFDFTGWTLSVRTLPLQQRSWAYLKIVCEVPTVTRANSDRVDVIMAFVVLLRIATANERSRNRSSRCWKDRRITEGFELFSWFLVHPRVLSNRLCGVPSRRRLHLFSSSGGSFHPYNISSVFRFWSRCVRRETYSRNWTGNSLAIWQPV